MYFETNGGLDGARRRRDHSTGMAKRALKRWKASWLDKLHPERRCHSTAYTESALWAVYNLILATKPLPTSFPT